MSVTVTCEPGFLAFGLQNTEQQITPVRIAATVITLTLTSAWFNSTKIKRLSMFFAHWLSGLVVGLGYMIEGMLIDLCWTASNMAGFIKTIKFFELAAFNMLAITNLAICVNLALIVVAHRTATRVKSVSSLPLIMLFLAISVMLAALPLPLWDTVVILGTLFGILGSDEADYDFIQVSYFSVELVVGICMFAIVAWLLLFRLNEITECWKLHRRIRYYFGLTLVGTAVNLSVGIIGLVNVLSTNPPVVIWGWLFRYIHIALDTVVLYGALIERNLSERGDNTSSGGSGGLSSRRSAPARGARRAGSRGSNISSNPVTSAPVA